MDITFFDTSTTRTKLLPLSYTRPVSDLRVGILTIHEKWLVLLQGTSAKFRVDDIALSSLYPRPNETTLTILGNVLPTSSVLQSIRKLSKTEVLVYKEEIIAGFFGEDEPIAVGDRKIVFCEEVECIHRSWDIFSKNGQWIQHDFDLLTKDKKSQKIQDLHTVCYGESVFISEGVQMKKCVLNAEKGPIYVGENVYIEEGAIIQGPVAICDHTVIKIGAQIRPHTTIGPYCSVGGEISNCVFLGYSNKAHHGFMGNAVIGSWCNFGAGTTNSNLKNNYGKVKMYDFQSGEYLNTTLQFCGFVAGDHTMTAINTALNTGTTTGVGCNVFGSVLYDKFISSFSWGSGETMTTYQLEEIIQMIEKMMKRKNYTMQKGYQALLKQIFECTKATRTWEKR